MENVGNAPESGRQAWLAGPRSALRKPSTRPESTPFPTNAELGTPPWPCAESPCRVPADPNLLLGGEGQRTSVSSICQPRHPSSSLAPHFWEWAATLGQWVSPRRLSQAGPLFREGAVGCEGLVCVSDFVYFL